MKVTKVEIIPIRAQKGLLAFASLELDNQFYVNSIGIHQKLDGSGFRITYPSRKVGEQNITICHPIQSILSKEIENEIFLKAKQLIGE